MCDGLVQTGKIAASLFLYRSLYRFYYHYYLPLSNETLL